MLLGGLSEHTGLTSIYSLPITFRSNVGFWVRVHIVRILGISGALGKRVILEYSPTIGVIMRLLTWTLLGSQLNRANVQFVHACVLVISMGTTLEVTISLGESVLGFCVGAVRIEFHKNLRKSRKILWKFL